MYTIKTKVLRALSGWKVAGKVAYGQNTIKADVSFCVSMCQLKEIEDKTLKVLSSFEVNLPLVSLFPLA